MYGRYIVSCFPPRHDTAFDMSSVMQIQLKFCPKQDVFINKDIIMYKCFFSLFDYLFRIDFV